ncbi:uncharacterized protein [Nicotiana sylvestris]|uniref:uncharacterized protein n=1 Tax=Nicotiana sylvestris TaxID=4096 RepID=UPI00388CB923
MKQKASGVLELDNFSAMRADIAKLANQMNRMTMKTQQLQHVQQMSICCEMCGDNHTSDICPTNPESIYYVGQRSRGPMNQQAQYENIYNANWRNHHNFSCSGNQSNQNQYRPQGNFNQPQRPPQQEAKKDDIVSVPVNVPRPPLPFPQRLQKKNDDRMFNKFPSMLIALTEECTSRVQNKLPQKFKDPDSFTIPVRIGNVNVGHGLCDLGESINLMSLSLYKKLGLGAPKPTTVMLQLADRSIAYPEGVIEDVLLKIRKFIFPADFIILDFEVDEKIPIILVRPLLATGFFRESNRVVREFGDNDEIEEMKHILNASCEYMKGLYPFEPLNRPNGPPPKPSIEEAPKLELKPLPSHLHYAYLGSSDTSPVMISFDLSEL